MKRSIATAAVCGVSLFGFTAVAALPASAASPTATASADLATSLAGPAGRIPFTGYYTYKITVTNNVNSPDPADTVAVSDSWWGGRTSFLGVSGTAPAGVSCTGPAGYPSTVTCTTASLAPGDSMVITLRIHVLALFHNQLVVDRATASSQTPDPNLANNTQTVVAEGI